MGYPKLVGVEKSERARRRRQEVGGKKVPRYAWSPYTAKPRRAFTFYADCELEEVITSPAGTVTKNITVPVIDGTFLEFKMFVRTGEAWRRCQEICRGYGGELMRIEGYWRDNHEGREPWVED